MQPRLTLVGRLGALGLGVLLFLGVAEILLRIIMPEWREFYSGRFMAEIGAPNQLALAIGRPGFDGVFAQNNGDFRVRVTINEFGLRNPEPVEAADGRIWIVGDSMSFGWGVERDEMFSSIVARAGGLKTYNVASPGADVCGYQALLARMPETVTPGAVIVGLTLENDLKTRSCRERAVAREAMSSPSMSLVPVKIFLIHRSALYNVLAVTVKKVSFLRELLTRIGLIRREHTKHNEFPQAEVPRAARVTGDELVRLAAQLPEGTPFAVLVIPSRFELRDGSPADRRIRLTVVSELAKRGLAAIDLYPDLKAGGFARVHFPHDGHWSALGHRVAGERIAVWLKGHPPPS